MLISNETRIFVSRDFSDRIHFDELPIEFFPTPETANEMAGMEDEPRPYEHDDETDDNWGDLGGVDEWGPTEDPPWD